MRLQSAGNRRAESARAAAAAVVPIAAVVEGGTEVARGPK
jgi:hypothetical protein